MPTSAPLVSIVVAAYNVEQWLEDCLESVRTQNHANFECIVVDDGSTDTVPDIASKFALADSRFQCIRHEKNRGLFHTRKTGLKHCNGDYVWQIDGDDYIDTQGLKHMVHIAESEGSDIVRGQFRVNRNDKVFTPKWFTQWPEIRNTSLESCAYLARSPSAIWLNLVRKDVLDSKVDFTNHPPANLGEDLVFNAALFPKSGKISLTGEVVYYYRRGQESYTTTSKADRLYLDEAICHAFAFSQWKHLRVAPLIYSVNNSVLRFERTCDLVQQMPKSAALEAIKNYQSIYKRWHPVEAYQIAKQYIPPDWSPEERPDVMKLLIAFHERTSEEVYDLVSAGTG